MALAVSLICAESLVQHCKSPVPSNPVDPRETKTNFSVDRVADFIERLCLNGSLPVYSKVYSGHGTHHDPQPMHALAYDNARILACSSKGRGNLSTARANILLPDELFWDNSNIHHTRNVSRRAMALIYAGAARTMMHPVTVAQRKEAFRNWRQKFGVHVHVVAFVSVTSNALISASGSIKNSTSPNFRREDTEHSLADFGVPYKLCLRENAANGSRCGSRFEALANSMGFPDVSHSKGFIVAFDMLLAWEKQLGIEFQYVFKSRPDLCWSDAVVQGQLLQAVMQSPLLVVNAH